MAAAIVTSVLAASAASAAPVISGLHYTGLDYSSTTPTQDQYWQVVALPVHSTFVPASLPYNAWIFTGSSGNSPNVPISWVGGGNNDGAFGGHWIGLQRDNADAILPNPDPLPPPPRNLYYSTIYSTTFESSDAGLGELWFLAAADNRVTFFVNGSITGTDTDQPTITGGEFVATLTGLASLKGVLASVTVRQGTNTLYAVVDDRIQNFASDWGYTGLIVVPEPSTYVSGALGLATMGLIGFGKRKGRRRD